jgi:hypothetical protein
MSQIQADPTQTVIEYKIKGNYSLDYHLTGGFYAGDSCTLLSAGQVKLKDDLKVLKSEEYTQVAFMDFVRLRVEPVFPEARWIAHYPAGGKRSAREGMKMKRSGTRKGIADIMFPYVSPEGSPALYIEFKQPGGVQTEEQRDFEQYALSQGAVYHIAITPLEAVILLEEYTHKDFTGHLR